MTLRDVEPRSGAASGPPPSPDQEHPCLSGLLEQRVYGMLNEHPTVNSDIRILVGPSAKLLGQPTLPLRLPLRITRIPPAG